MGSLGNGYWVMTLGVIGALNVTRELAPAIAPPRTPRHSSPPSRIVVSGRRAIGGLPACFVWELTERASAD